MRINKYLAHTGIATRREADNLIEKGFVFVNGKKAVLGQTISKTDKVEVRRKQKNKYVYLAFNKPVGIVTHSPQGSEQEIKDILDIKGVFPVGRLDKNSHGLIILTNDGRLTDKLLNPESGHEKEYLVTTKDKLRSSFKEKMEGGVKIEGYTTKPTRVDILGENKFKIILTEGKRHQIRRMVVALFNEVRELCRIRIMNIKLGNLKPGEYRYLEGDELSRFLTALGILQG
ncbi:MAG: 23S rRNA pseudouridine synthase F [Candidatus Zambryskibacteria bacterium CG10_big_fil_rev_8_21_14_0_10_42_12]|uniref:Pseudouridine synthase n=1 Tax=Candidatus Zambryskibacteria bacterium CG10_big_fil_rev_8_21_14_0_10_42_12 TaxID=1975115 RepID=A0A2H0QWP7_9BACT|nr:MAG: 23S rRNA pseudouridine synthase F [Candidatus Zambryskibacteria bacterium CG10_big_fil_rev_8_21_14_0_10_42_12]